MIRPMAKTSIPEVPRKILGIWFWYTPPSKAAILVKWIGGLGYVALMGFGIVCTLLYAA